MWRCPAGLQPTPTRSHRLPALHAAVPRPEDRLARGADPEQRLCSLGHSRFRQPLKAVGWYVVWQLFLSKFKFLLSVPPAPRGAEAAPLVTGQTPPPSRHVASRGRTRTPAAVRRKASSLCVQAPPGGTGLKPLPGPDCQRRPDPESRAWDLNPGLLWP
uniref:(Atlantic silverside) hypothetical protein n=1 Tax=Menidia menidia TaxID=238744 RepID=A0A8S4AKM4_9TELE|nr:unnamed protein product [Menidia menidia]